MLSEFVSKILTLGDPHYHKVGDLEWVDKDLKLIYPPAPKAIEISTLQGLVDLLDNDFEDVDLTKVFLHIETPTEVLIISKESDDYGRRQVFAKALYPGCKTFPFGQWLDPESFVIAAQQSFQRVKIQKDDGTFEHDLDYVLKVASKISAEHAAESDDDGFTQRVAVKQGVTLRGEQVLKPMVNLAPYRTFAEIDQVVSTFVFRARVGNGSANLALFEGDGGRWRLSAVAAIKAWLEEQRTTVKVIS